jgi:hypothetical protein
VGTLAGGEQKAGQSQRRSPIGQRAAAGAKYVSRHAARFIARTTPVVQSPVRSKAALPLSREAEA